MAKTKKAPELRFNGFMDDWEEKKLGDLALETYGGGTPKTSIDEYWNGDIAWIQSSDVAEEQLFNIIPRKFITKKGITASATKLIPENSIAIVTRVGVGKVAFMSYCYATSQDFLSLSKLNIDNWYGVYSIHKKIQSELHAVQGTSIKGITKEELLSKTINIPLKKEEQTKIGNLFQNLDALIALHQRKYNKLSIVKKAMLEKMFPKEGTDVPEIRFKGFIGKWERRKLGETVELYSGLTYSPHDVVKDGETLVLRSSNVKNSEIINADNVYVRSEVVNSINVHIGDIIVVVRNGSRSLIGKHAQIKKSMPNTVIGAFMTGIHYKHPDFINTLLNTSQFNREIEKNMGATINQITNGVFNEMSLPFPEDEEQKKIGEYFSELDDLISLHQRELDKLKNIKKACLEKMFV